MNMNVKRMLSFVLAALMLFALCACGETNVEETAAPEFVFKADYMKVPTENGDGFSPSLATKDGFYALTYVKTGERKLEVTFTYDYHSGEGGTKYSQGFFLPDITLGKVGMSSGAGFTDMSARILYHALGNSVSSR